MRKMKKEHILVVDDEQGMRQFLNKLLMDNGYKVSTAENGNAALGLIAKQVPDLALIDFKMPGMDGLQVLSKIKAMFPQVTVIMMTAYGTMENAIRAIRLGAYDYISKPFEIDAILLGLDKALEKKRLEAENLLLRQELKKTYTFSDIISENPIMLKMFELIKKVAPTKSTVLIQGQTGTGKELVARAIHALSPRQEKNFVPVDCAALTESLLESELFGHVRGAFTGASQDKKGLFEVADGGTIFLDEIGHISKEVQAKLLRVLQDGQIKRVGEALTRMVDVRLIAASNEDIEKAVKQGTFREDLFYRLNVVPAWIPPLMDRAEDIPMLVEHFILKYNRIESKKVEGMTSAALKILMDYSWPGNVRELENIIHRAVVMATEYEIDLADLPQVVRTAQTADLRDKSRTLNFKKAKQRAIESFEQRFLTEALMRHDGNVSQAAKEIGLDRRNLHKKLKNYKLKPR
ncbi:MAG: sigma-54 dependent transcriptional regulator [Candidatus Omnitrophica bacterium]|nr:sigma-54 dependent transcriptional regulator [Candidatus Omnitrophota bacterium]